MNKKPGQIKFKLDGKEGYINPKEQIVFYDERFFEANFTDPEFISKVNKAVRDSNPKMRKSKLNVGCGYRPKQDSLNLDQDPLVYPDVVRDIEEGLPFDSDKFKEVYSSHIIEHVKDVFFFIYEIWRVSKNHGKVTIIAPYAGYTEWAIQPDHLRSINYGWFDRWEPKHHSVQNESKQTRGAQFNVIRKELINECREIEFHLEVIK